MRQIKFRGKRIDNGEWVYGSFLGGRLHHILSHKTVEKTDSTSMFAGKEVLPVDPATVGQFTGLKDKAGVEIYEGDIVKVMQNDAYFTDDKPEEIITPITIDIVTEITDYNGGGPDGSTTFTEIEVIGNIHSNPELIENGTKH